MNVAAVILAAGESRRMGSPKALLRYREESFVDTLIGLFAGCCAPVIVVLGADAEQIRERASRPATFVFNADFERGQTSSMQCGLRAVPAEAEGVLFTLVDHPAVTVATLDALLADVLVGDAPRDQSPPAQSPPAQSPPDQSPSDQSRRDRFRPLVRVPRYRGQRGHPIWFARELITEFLALPEDGAAREIVRSHGAETEFVDVDDPGILADIDDPAAYEKLTGAAR